jgi:branched-chain amino acid transport system substrate-binding protein
MAAFSKLSFYTAIFVASMCSAGLSQAQIRIGQTIGITGPVAAAVNEINMGAKLYLNAVNAAGGINGQSIELVTLDDKFEVPQTVANATKLIADARVVALFLNRGTPHTEALLPLLAAGRIPLIAPSTGAMSLHSPVNPWVFNVRATYQLEAEKLTQHLGTTGYEKIAVLYTNDSFGADASQGAMKAFSAAGKRPVIYESIDRAKPDYTEVVKKIVAAKPLHVMIFGSSTSVAAGIKALRAAGSSATVATLSNNAASGFVKALGTTAPGVIVSQVFPAERKVSSPIVAEATKLAAAQKLQALSPAMIEGFAAAKVLVAGLKRAAKDGKEVSRANLTQALESFHRMDIGGLEVSYSNTDHTGLDFAELSIISVSGLFRR